MDLSSRTKGLLDEIEVQILDHMVVSRTETVGMTASCLIWLNGWRRGIVGGSLRADELALK